MRGQGHIFLCCGAAPLGLLSARSGHSKASTELETIQNYYLPARSMGMQSVGKEIQEVADGR